MISFKGEVRFTELTLLRSPTRPLSILHHVTHLISKKTQQHQQQKNTTPRHDTTQGLWLVWLGNSDVPGLIVCVPSSELLMATFSAPRPSLRPMLVDTIISSQWFALDFERSQVVHDGTLHDIAINGRRTKGDIAILRAPWLSGPSNSISNRSYC